MAANLRRLLSYERGTEEAESRKLVAALAPYQGMLYYHLLLARLEASGQLPNPEQTSTPTPNPVTLSIVSSPSIFCWSAVSLSSQPCL